MMKRLLAISVTALAGLGLAACSSGGSQSGSAGPQTTEEACELIDTSLTQLNDEMAESPGESTEEMGEMVILAKNRLGELNKKITNQEVLKVWEPVSELQIKMLEAVTEEDNDALVSAYAELEDHYEAFFEVCPVAEEQSQ